jgi:predicted ester cyclase
MKTIILSAAIILMAGLFASAQKNTANQKNKKMKNLTEIVLPFYQKALTVNTETNPAEVLNSILADNFVSEGTVDNKNKEQLIGQLGFFWKMIHDLKWEPVEIIENGNQVIVRSKVTGTPNSPEGQFFGLPTDGTKSFTTMSIDIHTIEDGKIVKVNHIEDWATALKQLKN